MSRTISQPPLSMPAQGLGKTPSRDNAKGLSEETTIYTETRMLQDQTGRLRNSSRVPFYSLFLLIPKTLSLSHLLTSALT